MTKSRSSSVAGFIEYLKVRFREEKVLYAHFERRQYRKCRWLVWRNRRRSEDRFFQRFVETFGRDVVVAYGAWESWGGMKGMASSPGAGFRRRLAQRVTVVVVPEYYTTKTCSRCGEEVKEDPTRMAVRRIVTTAAEERRKKSGREQSAYPVRGIRCCTSNICGGYKRWNRDLNAAINIRNNLLHALQNNREWDPLFSPVRFRKNHPGGGTT